MQFVYHPESGAERLVVEGEIYHYIFKVRRHQKGEVIALRNLQDGILYRYRIEEVDRRQAVLVLVDSEKKEVAPKRFFHLLWCVIDPKAIEKALPSLNEIGVGKITFIYCERSQKNFTLRFEKLQKILIASSQQCGRSRLMELEVAGSLAEALARYPQTPALDFGGEAMGCGELERLCVGPEGGFSADERALFAKVVGFDTPLVLRSETAACAASARVVL
jgi:16S rRNA (uracil1498-N3)-methyltransferase